MMKIVLQAALKKKMLGILTRSLIAVITAQVLSRFATVGVSGFAWEA